MDKPTEHQPLDDFFRRNLSDASVPTKAEGWTRLQSRLGEQQLTMADKSAQRIGVAWYWSASAAAACFLIALLWVNWNKQPTLETNKPELAIITQTEKKVAQKPDRKRENSVTSETEKFATATTPTNEIETSVKYRNSYSNKERGQDVRNTDKPTTDWTVDVDQPSLIAETVEKQPEKIQPQSVPEGNSTVASTSRETSTKSILPNSERTLIVSVGEPIPEHLPVETARTQNASSAVAREMPVRNARITHVFRQIKRLKDGEVLAKVDVNLNGEDDESGLFNRLVRSTRSKENQTKQQK